MAKKGGVKMNLSEFNGPLSSDLPSAPSESSTGGGYGGRTGGYGDRSEGGERRPYGDRGDRGGDDRGERRPYGDRDGGERRPYGDRQERRPRFNEDGEEEPQPPSRADEADKWRRSGPITSDRPREELPGRADEEDKWRRGGDAPPRSYGGGDRSYGGDRDRSGPSGSYERRPYGDRDGGERRPYGGDRDGERRPYGSDRDGERRPYGGDRDGGERRPYGRDGPRGFGGRDTGDSRPAHLRFGKKSDSSDNLAADRSGSDSQSAASPSPNPVSDRFKKPPPEPSEGGEDGERQERRGGYGDRDRDGGDRPRYGGGDRDGGNERSYERRPYGGDRQEGGERRPYGGSDRFGDRDGGDRPRYGGYGGNRDGGYEPRGAREGGNRYGGYGGARSGAGGYGDRPSMNDPLPTGPASRQEEPEVSRPKLNLKAKSNLDAKPQSMEERKVEVDSSLTSKGVVSLADKLTPLESALEDNTTITEAQLSESMNRLKLDKDVVGYGNVLAKSLIDGTVSLNSLVSAVTTKQTPELLLQALSQLRAKKSDKFLLDLIAAAKSKEPELDVVRIISGGKKDKELDTFLEANSLLALKPIPDLSESVAAQIASGASPADILTSINSQVDAKLAPGAKVAGLIATSLFTSAFKKEVGKVDLELVKSYKALLQRVAPNSDVDAQLRVLFDAQYAWFNESKQAKAILKELFLFLYNEKIIRAQSFDAYANDTKEKQAAKLGRMKALLQLSTWIQEIQPKQRVAAEDEAEEDIDDELEAEYGDRD